MNIKIKALEWSINKALGGGEKLVARGCIGDQFARLDLRGQSAEEIEAFKAEKQADYEHRIRSAVDADLPVLIAAFPTAGESHPFGSDHLQSGYAPGMSLRTYAAIKLHVPESGIDWLDDMIRRARRDEIAGQALLGMLANPSLTLVGDQNLAEKADTLAEIMLVASDAKT